MRAVLFDFGGTLFSYGPMRAGFERLIEDAARRCGIEAPAAELRRAYTEQMMRAMADLGARPFYLHRELFADAMVRFLRALGADPDPSEGAAFYAAQTRLGGACAAARADAAETLGALRARGLHVGIVSNIDDDQFAVLWERVALGAHADAVTTSEEARSCKPDPGIYRLALAKAGGIDPEDAVFVGDSAPHDVAGANALGMTSVLLSRTPPSPAAATPTHVIATLSELLRIVGA